MSKENITEFAKRMRELAGLSEGENKKSIKKLSESFDQEDYELEDRIIKYGINPEINPIDDEFDSIEFEQSEIEEGEEDLELYNLNENSIIVLDFKDTLGQ